MPAGQSQAAKEKQTTPYLRTLHTDIYIYTYVLNSYCIAYFYSYYIYSHVSIIITIIIVTVITTLRNIMIIIVI